MDDEQTRGLIARARQLREDARVPPGVLAAQIHVPVPMLRAWETHPPDVARLSRRDELAVRRWLVLLAGLARASPAPP